MALTLLVICPQHVCTVKANGVCTECMCELHTIVHVPHTFDTVQDHSQSVCVEIYADNTVSDSYRCKTLEVTV